jgi:hypothetical protein
MSTRLIRSSLTIDKSYTIDQHLISTVDMCRHQLGAKTIHRFQWITMFLVEPPDEDVMNPR